MKANLVTVRKSGGARIISLPRTVTEALNLDAGSQIVLSVAQDGLVTLKAVNPELTLEQMLAGYSPGDFAMAEKDRAWLEIEPVGKELF